MTQLLRWDPFPLEFCVSFQQLVHVARAAGLARATALRIIQTQCQRQGPAGVPQEQMRVGAASHPQQFGPCRGRRGCCSEPLEDFVAVRPATITTAEALRIEVSRIREQGFAIVRDEEEEGLSAIATGVHDRSDELLGVLVVAGPTQRLDRQRQLATERLLGGAALAETVLRRGSDSPAVFGARREGT